MPKTQPKGPDLLALAPLRGRTVLAFAAALALCLAPLFAIAFGAPA